MLSISSIYKVKTPKLVIPFTGKLTKELNKRQNYNKLYKKPYQIQQKLPTTKNTSDEISRQTERE